MLPVQVEFPKFVPDQLLTSEDLNHLFGYLDEQNRITRTNLIGIGIVCGLQLQINSTKTEVKITKGCGVTSEGYLIAYDPLDKATGKVKSYLQYKAYKVDTPIVYDKFYKPDGSGGKIPMNVWELKQAAEEDEILPFIDADFLKDKVILLFVELKEEDNKICDPNSCDDKGINITVSFLPMAVDKADAALLMGTTAGSFGVNTYTSLPELRMKRWDVPNTTPVYSKDIFDAYFKILDKSFIDQVETTLKNIYSVFGGIVATDYSTNPFNGLSTKFQFLYNGTLNGNQLIHLQYYYDLFSDLLLAYHEFRKAGTHVLSTCCPDSDLFPRHLLLGEAIPSVSTGILPYRHYFIYSPLFDQQNMLAELKMLFTKLVLMIDQFYLPTVQGNNTKEDTFLRITPSMLWDVPLSQKAIPYYYQVNSGSQPLYLNWDYRRTLLNDAKRNLSYHAAQYNSSDDFVLNPLNYDLEPTNFLRVEGIVGKSYVHVLKQVKQKIQKNRLPVDIIALSTDTGVKVSSNLSSLTNRTDAGLTAMEMICHFQDLESMYDSLRREILCLLCKELQYYYDFRFALFASFLKKFTLANQLSQVTLFDNCAKGYVIKDRSLGLMIEFLYRKGYTDETLTLENLFEELGFDLTDANNDDIPDEFSQQVSTILLALLNFFKIPLGIIRLSGLLTEDLSDFDVKAYCDASNKLAEYAKSLKTLFGIITAGQKTTTATTASVVGDTTGSTAGGSTGGALSNLSTNTVISKLALAGNSFAAILILIFMIEDFLDHLDTLIYNCKCSAFLSLKKDYLRRYLMVSKLKQFGYFSQMHPGIQHKAGVPMGGTFIIVYHSGKTRTSKSDLRSEEKFTEGIKFKEAERKRGFVFSKEIKEKQTLAEGMVFDEEKDPIAGAIVSVAETGESTVTNSKGEFKLISSVIPYTLVVEAAGFEDYEEIKTDDDTKIRIVLTANKGDVFSELQQGTVIADFYLPYRCCSDCPPIQYIVQESTPAPTPNQGPIANAGPDQVITLPVNTATLNGSASTDPDGSITFFQWAKLSGPGTTSFVTPNSSQTDVKDMEQGIYIFELSVTDDKGSIARDTVQVTVNAAPPPPNKPPVADAGKDETIVMSFVTATSAILDGSNSKDEDGSIVAFKWNQLSGSTVNISSPSLVQTVVTGFQPGIYEFELIVTDNDGASASDKVVITVIPPPNKPPVADAGPDQSVTITPNGSITLNGSNSSDPEGGTLTFDWNLAGGPNAAIITDKTKAVTTVNGLTNGDYKFELKVTDDKGDSASDTVIVSVKINDIPQKTCGPLSDIIKLFEQLETVDPQRFPLFTNADGFTSIGNVKEFFAQMQSIVNSSTDKQIDFFATITINGLNIQDSVIAWLTQLQKLIVERKDLRLLALALYRVFNLLAMYIVCIQKEDFDVAKVPMAKVFTLINRHVKQWVDLISTGLFTPKEIALVKVIGDDIEKEIKRVDTNGETAAKPKYLRMLNQILSVIRSIP